MFGLSFWEIAIILGIALIVLGPKKLPEIARSLGKGIREFRRATDDFKSSVESGMAEDDDARPNKQLEAPAQVEPMEAKKDEEKAAEAEAAVVAQVEEAKRASPGEAPEGSPKSELPEAEPPPWEKTEAKSEG